MNDHTGLRSHLDLGIGIAVSTLFFIGVALIPAGGTGVIVFLPLPTLLFYAKLGRWRGMSVCFVSLAATAVILLAASRPLDLMPVLVIASLTGLVLGELTGRRVDFVRTLAIGSAVLALLSFALLLAESLRTGIAPWHIVATHLSDSLRENLKLYAELDLPPEQVAIIRDNAPQFLRFLLAIFPSVAAAGIVLSVWANLLAARFLLRRREASALGDPDLSRWKAPEGLIWLLIIGGGLTLVPHEWAKIAGVNVLILCGFVYLLQGLAIMGFLFRMKRVPAWLRFLFYALLVLQQYLLLIVAAFGMFDLWVDFRRFIKPRDDPSL